MADKQVWVYLVRCTDNTLYCGVSTDVRRRFEQHRNGTGAKYTRSHGAEEIVWQSEPTTLSIALCTEHVVKKLGRPLKNSLIRGDLSFNHRRNLSHKIAAVLRMKDIPA